MRHSCAAGGAVIHLTCLLLKAGARYMHTGVLQVSRGDRADRDFDFLLTSSLQAAAATGVVAMSFS